MTYKILVTKAADEQLESCIRYLLDKLKSEKAARHLVSGIAEVYRKLEHNPEIYKISSDPFIEKLKGHEVKIPGMDYRIIYKIEGDIVYILGIFHILEEYTEKVKILYSSINPRSEER